MNPSTNEAAGFNLPPPVLPEGQPSVPNTAPASSAETVATPSGSVPAANPLLPVINLPVPTAPLPTSTTSSVSNTTSNANPVVAEDTDLIEKEWVQKAKNIIKQNQNNPHLQSRELNVFKADYMQKRYNKVLKLSE